MSVISGGGGGALSGVSLHIGGDLRDTAAVSIEGGTVSAGDLAFIITDLFDDEVLSVLRDNLTGLAHRINLGGTLNMNANEPAVSGVAVRVPGGQTAPVIEGVVGGASLFEVRPDGSVHIKTGKAVVADL
jgi:hypothetical protein